MDIELIYRVLLRKEGVYWSFNVTRNHAAFSSMVIGFPLPKRALHTFLPAGVSSNRGGSTTACLFLDLSGASGAGRGSLRGGVINPVEAN
jgi:hypothetical protein